MPTYQVVKQTTANHNPKIGLITFRHNRSKVFYNLEEAQKNLKQSAKDIHADENIYLVEDDTRTIEAWDHQERRIKQII